jgi:hypothetical protein
MTDGRNNRRPTYRARRMAVNAALAKNKALVLEAFVTLFNKRD